MPDAARAEVPVGQIAEFKRLLAKKVLATCRASLITGYSPFLAAFGVNPPVVVDL